MVSIRPKQQCLGRIETLAQIGNGIPNLYRIIIIKSDALSISNEPLGLMIRHLNLRFCCVINPHSQALTTRVETASIPFLTP